MYADDKHSHKFCIVSSLKPEALKPSICQSGSKSMIMHQTFLVLKTDKPETPKLQKLQNCQSQSHSTVAIGNHSLCSISETSFLAMNRYYESGDFPSHFLIPKLLTRPGLVLVKRIGFSFVPVGPVATLDFPWSSQVPFMCSIQCMFHILRFNRF